MLQIVLEDGSTVQVVESDAPELVEAFAAWRRTSPRSLQERAAWDALLELATDYCDGEDNPAEDVTEVPIVAGPLLLT